MHAQELMQPNTTKHPLQKYLSIHFHMTHLPILAAVGPFLWSGGSYAVCTLSCKGYFRAMSDARAGGESTRAAK